MQLPRIPLFDWLLEYLPKTQYDLANSSITGVPLDEFLVHTGFELPKDFNLGKNDPFGAQELRQALSDIYNCDFENVVTTTGGSEANFLVFLGLLEPGDEVIVEQPGYSPLWLVPQMLGAKVVYWERLLENGFDLDIESLKEKITTNTKLVVITNLHNPSGVVAERDIIQAIADLAEENNALLFIDEMFLDVAEEPQKTAFGMDSVLVTASVSKIYGIGGLRTGWIIAQKDIAARCLQAKWQATVAAPYISEIYSAAALTYAREKLINRCKKIAQRNHPIVNEWMKEYNEFLEYIPPAGGVLCFPKYHFQKQIDSVTLGRKLMDEKSILISPGEYFGKDGHFRLTYMNPENELRTALTELADVLQMCY